MLLSSQPCTVGTAVDNCFADENEMHPDIHFFLFAIFPTKPFSHVPIFFLLLLLLQKNLRTPLPCRHVVKRSPEKAAGFSAIPTTISSLINLRRKAHMKSAVAAVLTAVFGVFLGRARAPWRRSESPITATLARGAKSYMPRTFRMTPKHLQMCLELW